MSDISFSKLTWENLPARTTALSAQNLNRIENGINDSVNGVNSNSHSIAELQTRISQIANGSPTPVATVAEMTDESAVYLYTGSETGYTAGNWYYYDGTSWTSGGTYGGAVTDTTLSIEGAAADAKAAGDAIADKADADDLTALETTVSGKADSADIDGLDQRVTVLEEGGSGITNAVKDALLAILRNVAYIGTDGQDLYDDLYDALYSVTAIRLDTYSVVFTAVGDTAQITATTVPAGGTVTWESSDTSIATVDQTGLVTSIGYGSAVITATSGSASASCSITVSQVTLSSISVVYTQSGTVLTTDSLDSLKSGLVVTAAWSDGTTSTVSGSNYVLSGTLTAGSSTITVNYGGKTATFSVTVSEEQAVLQSITAVFNQGSAVIYTDSSLDDLKPYLTVTARYSDSTTQTITNYALSGTLTAGTSIITASYGGKTATFNVVVSEAITVSPIYNWDFTKSLTDTISGKTATTNATRDSNGVTFSSPSQYIDFSLPFARNRTYEVDIDYIGNRVSQYTGHRRVFVFGTNGTITESNTSAFLFSDHSPAGWWWYLGDAWDTQVVSTQQYSYFDGKTLKIYIDADGYGFVYAKLIGGNTYEYVGKSTGATTKNEGAYVFMGGSGNDGLANARIKAFRVYEGEK